MMTLIFARQDADAVTFRLRAVLLRCRHTIADAIFALYSTIRYDAYDVAAYRCLLMMPPRRLFRRLPI